MTYARLCDICCCERSGGKHHAYHRRLILRAHSPLRSEHDSHTGNEKAEITHSQKRGFFKSNSFRRAERAIGKALGMCDGYLLGIGAGDVHYRLPAGREADDRRDEIKSNRRLLPVSCEWKAAVKTVYEIQCSII